MEKEKKSTWLKDYDFSSEDIFSEKLSSSAQKLDWSQIVGDSRVLVIGDGAHAEEAGKSHLAGLMKEFSKRGITHLGLEAFLDKEQGMLDDYHEFGKGRGKIEKTLRDNLSCPETTEEILEILDNARKNNVKVIALTPNADKGPRSSSYRDHFAAKKATEIMKNFSDSKILLVMGPHHSYPERVPGKIKKLAKMDNIGDFEITSVNMLGMEPDIAIQVQGADFSIDRVIREKNMSYKSFMLKRKSSIEGIREFIVHLPQNEKFLPYENRCRY